MRYVPYIWKWAAAMVAVLSLAVLLVAGVLFLAMPAAHAGPLFKVGAEESSNYQQAEAVACPKPEIPEELHEQCFKSCCIARFLIKPDGKHDVKLISSSGCDQADDIAIHTLQQWRFRPAMLNGKPIESSRKIKVEFEVE